MSLLHLPEAARAWGGADFGTALKAELEALGAQALPLLAGMQHGSHVPDTPLEVMALRAQAVPGGVLARVGVFFASVLGGCSCADDPTPVEAQPEYCELEIRLDPVSGRAEARVTD